MGVITVSGQVECAEWGPRLVWALSSVVGVVVGVCMWGVSA